MTLILRDKINFPIIVLIIQLNSHFFTFHYYLCAFVYFFYKLICKISYSLISYPVLPCGSHMTINITGEQMIAFVTVLTTDCNREKIKSCAIFLTLTIAKRK